jgi:hypothetical protein
MHRDSSSEDDPTGSRLLFKGGGPPTVMRRVPCPVCRDQLPQRHSGSAGRGDLDSLNLSRDSRLVTSPVLRRRGSSATMNRDSSAFVTQRVPPRGG